MFELAIVSDEISLDLDEALQHGNAFGFNQYEIRCLDDYDHRVPFLPDARIAQLESAVDGGAMEITALSPGTFKIDPGDRDSVEREMHEVLPKTCELALRLGTRHIISFAFMRNPGVEFSDIVTLLRESGRIINEFGLELWIENEPGSYCDTGVNTAAMIKAVDMPAIGINWDPANGVYAGEMAYPVGYDAALPYIRNVHLKDGIPLPHDKWENRLLGDGGVNWVGQLAALMRDKPVQRLTLETHVFPLLESTREDLRRLRILFETASKFIKTAI